MARATHNRHIGLLPPFLPVSVDSQNDYVRKNLRNTTEQLATALIVFELEIEMLHVPERTVRTTPTDHREHLSRREDG